MFKNTEAKTIRKVLWIALFLLLMILIFILSAQSASSPDGISDSLANLVKTEQTGPDLSTSHQSIWMGLTLRKIAHIFLYCCLGLCMYQALEGWKHRIQWSFAFSFLYCIIDVAVHHGKWQNTLIDLIGISIGIGLAFLLPSINRQMKKWLYCDLDQKPEKKKTVAFCLDALALGSVLHYAAFRFLQQSTMFPLIYSDRYKTITLLLLIVFGGIRFAYLFLRKLWNIEDEKKRIGEVIRFLFLACLALPFFYVGMIHDLKVLIYTPFAALCLYDMKVEKVLRWFVLVIGALFLATILCCAAGVIPNIVRYDAPEFAGSYGFINTTDFAAYLLFLPLFAWCAVKKRFWYTDLFFAFLAAGAALLSNDASGSRTAMFSCLLMTVFCLFELLRNSVLNHSHRFQWIVKTVDGLTAYAFPLAAISLVVLCCLYRLGYPWIKQLNTILSDRLSFTVNLFEKYGLKLFGSGAMIHGHGRSMLGSYTMEYDFPDASYAYLLFCYGIMITLIAGSLWVVKTIQAIKNDKRRIAYSMAVICLYAISESHFVDVNYNIFLIMPFCAFSSLQVNQKDTVCGESAAERKTAGWFSWISAGIILAVFFFMAPQIMSRLRTLFFLQKWNSGMATGYALLVCLAIPMGGYLIWRMIQSIRYQRNTAALAAALVVVFAFIYGNHLVNQAIDFGMTSHADEIHSEKETIDYIISSAEQPVYAFEKSELYRRSMNGMTDFAASIDDFCRQKEGSVLTDVSRECIPLTAYGAKYLQFSDTSGVYSFDPAVISALESEGFQWKAYYNSERVCDLKDLAQLNNLEWNQDTGLLLDGPEHSLAHNRPIDLVGNFRARYSLRLNPETKCETDEESVCTIRVAAFDGEVLILEKDVSINDFDENGTYTVIFSHGGYIGRVEYLVFANTNMKVYVDEIAWQRIAF